MLTNRIKSFGYALRGLWVFVRSQVSAWLQIGVMLAAVLLGIYFQISYLDWMLLTFAAGLVLSAEAFNTAIEINTDLTHAEYHPLARDTKDVAAGAVLIASITSIIIGLGIFGHYFTDFFSR